MSRIYSSTGIVATGASVAQPLCDLESSAIESPAVLAIDFSVRIAAGNAFRIGIGRASNTPVPILSQPFIAEDPNDPACTSIAAVAWSTAPTVPASYHRMFSYFGSTPQYVLYTFFNFKLAPSSSLVLWSFGSNLLSTFNIGWEIEL